MAVTQKKDGRWFAVTYDNGRQVWEAFGRGDNAKKAALARDLEIRLAKLKHQRGPSMVGRLTTFHELMELYINARYHQLSDNTRDGILRCYRRYAKPEIATTPISQLTLEHWRRIEKNMVARRIKPRTINTYFKYLHHVLQWAVQENDHLLADDPWAKRKHLKEDRYQINLFSMEDFRKILDEAEDHVAWALEVAYYTGARTGRSELFALKWADVDHARGRLWIPGTKTKGSPRWQYPDPVFMRRLKRRQVQDAKDYPGCPYICHYRGQRIQSIKTSFAEAKKKAGITRRIRLTDIRHYHITYALASGADIHELASRVGHLTPRMIVDVYSHLAKDILKNKPHQLPKITPAAPKTPPLDILY